MKAKILFFFSLFLFALFSLSAAPEGSAKAEFDRQTVRLAAKLQLHTFEEEFFRRFPARVETALAEDMKRHPQLHREKAKSFLLSGKMTAQEAEKQFIAGATERLSPYQLSSKELNSLLLPGREARKKHFDALFALLYEKSRQQALWEQRKAMLPVILPDGETVEKSSDEALKREIARRFAVQVDRKLLWEENERFFQNEMIPKIISTVREQQKTQLQLLSEIRFPLFSWEAGETEVRLTGEVEKALTKKYPDPLWRCPLFPATKREISRRAGRAAYERVMAFFSAVPLPEGYGKKVQDSPAAHRIAAESLRAEEAKWIPDAIASAMEKAEVPPGKRMHIAGDAEVKQRAAQEFTRRVLPELKKERARFAETQAKKAWPELFSHWQPEMESVELFEAAAEKKVPEISSRPGGREFLEETEAIFEKILREKLTGEIPRLRKQRQCVSLVYEEVFRAVSQQRDKGKHSFLARWFGIGGTPSLSAVNAQYEKLVASKSSSPLFPSVRKEIEVRSRAILQQLAREEELPEKTTPPETKEEIPCWSVTLQEDSGVLLLRWEEFSCRERDPRQCAAVLRNEIRRRMEKEKLTSVRLQLLVSGDEIRYRTVAVFREELRKSPNLVEVSDTLKQP